MVPGKNCIDYQVREGGEDKLNEDIYVRPVNILYLRLISESLNIIVLHCLCFASMAMQDIDQEPLPPLLWYRANTK